MPVPRKPPITKVCAHCGRKYTRPNWKVWRASTYCSADCYTGARLALPAEQRAALMTEATSRIRGQKRSHEDLCKRARTKQERLKLSDDESEILRALQDAGLSPVPHLAFDKYNLDFAFPVERVAIEYHGGNWHNTAAKHEQDVTKAAFLREQGWALLVFPRLDKPQANNAGNRRIAVADIVRQTAEAVHRLTPQPAG